MARLDLETILDKIKLLFQAKLTAKLAALDAEKNDGITLPTVENGAYFLQGYHEGMANFNQFIVYGVEKIDSTSVNALAAKSFSLYVELAMTDQGMNNENMKKLLRYGRALEEIVNENFDKILGNTRFQTSLLEPAAFEDVKGGVFLKSVGVRITASIA